jgi:penicillin-binding protein 2
MAERLSIQRRVLIGSIVAGLFLLMLLVKMIYLQVFRYDYLYSQSENNRIRMQPVIPPRGVIYDRNHVPIVDNRASYTLSVVPAEATGTPAVDNLANLLGVTDEELRQRIRKNTINRYQPATVKRDIGFGKIAVLEEQNEEFPGAVYRQDQARQYCDSLDSECFTGYVGEISQDEMANLDQSIYRAGRMIGKAGIEKYYDRDLRGMEGTQYLEIAASGQLLGEMEDYPGTASEPGKDLVLTIDLDVQKVAAKAFGEYRCGAAVAIDPRSGEVLAMVSKPSPDANIFSTVIPDSLWKAILADSANPLLNRPLDGLYPPGSTYKLVIAGAGLELGLIDKYTQFTPCVGGYQFGNRFFRCWNAGGHGKLSVIPAIEQSCDVFFYQLGYKLGLDEFNRFSQACGFGHKTGIDLPQEAAGNVPDKEWYDKHYGERRWTQAVLLNLGIGQGEILATPLQVAQFYCGLANNGLVYRPHLLKAEIGPDGRETSRGAELSFTLPFSEKTLGILKEGLIDVVNGEHGTARGSHLKNITVAGKTGTAQNPHGEDHSWFVGFAPAESPEIVVCAIVENAGHGSEVAAPLVRDVIKAYMDKNHPVDSNLVATKGKR